METRPKKTSDRDQAVPGSRIILACEMLEDEVLLALRRTFGSGEHPPLVWIESGLHEWPDQLQGGIQELVDLVDQANREQVQVGLPSVRPGQGPAAERREEVAILPPVSEILLGLGYCGNGLQDLVSETASLVFPRVDDCISLFLNAGCQREDIERDAHAFYLTKGWLCHDNPVTQSFEQWRERFGEDRARRLRRSMMAVYQRITLIDTGAYDVAGWEPRSRAWAEDLDLEHSTLPGSIQLLERLLTGPWDSEIVVVAPGEAISIRHLFDA